MVSRISPAEISLHEWARRKWTHVRETIMEAVVLQCHDRQLGTNYIWQEVLSVYMLPRTSQYEVHLFHGTTR